MNPVIEDLSFRYYWNSENPLPYDRFVEAVRYFGDLLPDPLSQRMDIEQYANKLLQFAEVGYVLHEGKIVGMRALYANDMETKIAHGLFMTVLPEYRGHGVGTLMFSRSIALIRQRGMKTYRITVDIDNVKAKRLYSSIGFRVSACQPPKYVMELRVDTDEEILTPRVTPIDSGSRLATTLGLDIDLRIKRDDLYPLSGGGIKARKAVFIIKHAIEQGYDVLVTNGGPQSNHARATAIIAANLGLRCHLVIVLDPDTAYSKSGNILLMRMSGATIEYCAKDELAGRMDQAMSRLIDRGHKPFYIWGGGHCLQGTVAFVEAAGEARRQCGEWIPDYVVLASATGSTQAGLAIGYADLPTQVLGISVARDSERGEKIIRECIDEYQAANNQVGDKVGFLFRDDWTDGGYEKYSPELLAVIERAARVGYYFDPTYSGKALRGLVSMVNQSEIPPGSKVLLWHTGGLMNLQATLNYTEGTFQL